MEKILRIIIDEGNEFEARLIVEEGYETMVDFIVYRIRNQENGFTEYENKHNSDGTTDIGEAKQYFGGRCRWRGCWEETILFGQSEFDFYEIALFQPILSQVFEQCKQIIKDRVDYEINE